MNEPRKKDALAALAIAVAAAVAHAPAVGGETSWDDQGLAFQNPLVLQADGFWKAWSVAEARSYYAPLTTQSFWIDQRLWGADPIPRQIENVALHAACAMALALVARRLGLGRMVALLAGLLFAVHPVTVESVAWIAERKNPLSALLALFATYAFLRFEETARPRWYAAALALGSGALLAKSAVVALPLVWLALAWWRRGAIDKRDLLRVTPLLVVSVSIGLVTMGLEQPAEHASLTTRVAAAGGAVWFYLGKLLLPVDLAMLYPRWKIDGAHWALPLTFLVVTFAVCFRQRRGWGRGPVAALAIFLVTVAPALGVIPMAYSDRSWVADHLQYAPMIALIVLAAAAMAPHFGAHEPGRSRVPWIVACGVVPFFLALTLQQSAVHQTEEGRWTQALAQSPGSPLAHYNRGLSRSARGDELGALEDYDAAIASDDRLALAFNNRGNIYLHLGVDEIARADFDRAIAIDPHYAGAFNNRGNLRRKSDLSGSIADLTRAIEIDPGYAQAHANRGVSLTMQGDFDGAVRDFTRAADLAPGFFMPWFNRGLLLEERDDLEAAVADYDRAIALAPDEASLRTARLRALIKLRRIDAAREDAAAIERLGEPIDPELRRELGSP